MKGLRAITLCCVAFLVAVEIVRAAAAEAPGSVLGADAILSNVIERSRLVARNDRQSSHTYTREALQEELGEKGEVIRKTSKTYKVLLVSGLPFSKLESVDGRRLSEADARVEDEKEAVFLKKVSAKDFKAMREAKEPWVTPELVARYDFKVVGESPEPGRPSVVLEFRPRPSNPEKTIQDRIYNRLAGRIWVDKEDFEIARLDVRMTQGFSLGWFGMLGSVSECDLSLERGKMGADVWINRKQQVLVRGRKLFSPMHYRTTELASGFNAGP